ncbi:MAG: M20 family metallo-hydrolase [Thermoplasmataceae archaeon]|jgi:succinyl-diaminopimelate desuccinylase|nr:M20 family metallo-hydrolase [Candidatus Thermoplasmatota archaeon]MCL5440215.1 M20 family metallo-hydrolase [Candidatus Thermoplasmatota archaeon]
MKTQVETDFETAVRIYRRLIPIKSISPTSGGEGESRKADEICKILEEMGFSNYNRYNFKDDSGFSRPNIVLKLGNKERTLWFISHIDTVPEGSLDLWTRPPFTASIEGNKVYGRGSADNGEGIVSSLLMLKNLEPEKMKYNLGLAFVADEETGSKYGIAQLLDTGNFNKDDLIVVPDSGTEEGNIIEVAEKSILWLKVVVNGKQGHASRPDLAINASKLGMIFMLSIEKSLHEKFNASDKTFEYPLSTFSITKHEKNVDNINTIPGKDTFYLDCRILPVYDLDSVMDYIREEALKFAQSNQVKIEIIPFQKEQAPPDTKTTSEVYTELSRAVKRVLDKDAKAIGIGGGTCAAFFRRRGINAVVWGISVEEKYHQPDEYVVVDNVIKAAEVQEAMLYG